MNLMGITSADLTSAHVLRTIDEIYTGEISAVFYHVMPNMPRYKVGDKVCQLCLERTESLEFVEVTELRKTSRGEHGYGSTGK